MSNTSRKRRLPQQNDISAEKMGEPAQKKRKLELNDQDNAMIMFDIMNIRDIILDHLSFSNENVSLFIYFGNDDYFNRRLLNLNKNDVINIKQIINNSTNKFTKYDINNLCILYANFKCLFGNVLFQKLLNIPLSTFLRHNKALEIDEICSISDIKEWSSNGLTFFGSMTIKLKSHKDITKIFDNEQILFLENNNINLRNCNKFKIQKFESNPHCKYEILPIPMPSNPNSDSWTYSTFGFSFDPKPNILMIPILNDFKQKKEFHSKDLLPSIERLFILRDPNSTHNEYPLNLYLDHDFKQYKLNKIFIHGKKHHDFAVNIKPSISFPDDFEILNLKNKCDIKFDIFSNFPLKISKNEIQFLQSCKGEIYGGNDINNLNDLNDDTADYKEYVVENGLINISYNDDEYFLSINKTLELQLFGYGLSSINRDNFTVIHTNEIPLHWKIMRIGKRFCPLQAILRYGRNNEDDNLHFIVSMDGFSDNMDEFSITELNVNLEVSMEYDEIPDNMKIIRLPYWDYDFIMREFAFFIDKSLSAQDLSYKPIEFKFYEMLFSHNVTPREIYDDDDFEDEDEGYINIRTLEINEYALEKLINPVFNTKYDNEIVIYRRKNIL